MEIPPSLRIPRHPTLIRQMRDARLDALTPRCPPLVASLCEIGNTGRHHVTLKQDGKTRTVYVPKDLKDEVESWIEEHRRLKQLMVEITQLQLALIQSHLTEQARRAGKG